MIQQQQVKSTSSNYEAILYNGEMFTYYKSGLTRRVFINKEKTLVLKINIEHDYNINESEIYESTNEENKIQMANTVLTTEGYILQEYCVPIDESDNKLSIKQILFSESCRKEVGWTSDNRLVCFDLDEFKKY